MKLHVTALTVLCFTAASAQTVVRPEPKPVRRNNTVYAELGGICAFYSVNYQRAIPISNKLDVAGGVSFGPVFLHDEFSSHAQWSPRLGVQAQAIYKVGRHELGAGPAACWYTYRYPRSGSAEANYEEVRGAVFAQAGYSYTTRAGLYLGAYFTPIVFDAGYFDYMPWAGLRVGYRF